mmetsp:Transcript_112967/g.352098  ORF Transcript_112967/g.352098 Transcript_112967/m.352098 type:complete len:200 (-) Transcript_112967:592-1191(-)
MAVGRVVLWVRHGHSAEHPVLPDAPEPGVEVAAPGHDGRLNVQDDLGSLFELGHALGRHRVAPGPVRGGEGDGPQNAADNADLRALRVHSGAVVGGQRLAGLGHGREEAPLVLPHEEHGARRDVAAALAGHSVARDLRRGSHVGRKVVPHSVGQLLRGEHDDVRAAALAQDLVRLLLLHGAREQLALVVVHADDADVLG